MKIVIRHYLQGPGRWPAIAGAVLVVALLAAPVQAAEPATDHPNKMNCGNIFWLTPPHPAGPDYRFYREAIDRSCREAQVTRGVTAVIVSVLAVFGVALLAHRHDDFLP